MDYAVYYKAMHDAAAAVEAEDYETSIAGFHGLLDADISDLDKAMICNNLAVICDKLGDIEGALSWYDAGMAYEAPYMRFFIAECKAKYLADHAHAEAALAIYAGLATQPYLNESDKDRIVGNMNILRGS